MVENLKGTIKFYLDQLTCTSRLSYVWLHTGSCDLHNPLLRRCDALTISGAPHAYAMQHHLLASTGRKD